MYKPQNATQTPQNENHYICETGLRNYELKDHMGNVMVVLSDKKNVIQSITGQAYFKADVVVANDYYAFGYQISDRTAFSPTYRFSWNGKEQNGEISGRGINYDLGLRFYDAKVGRMFSVDPRAVEYAYQTTYSYHGNNPVNTLDYMGGGEKEGSKKRLSRKNRKAKQLERAKKLHHAILMDNSISDGKGGYDYTDRNGNVWHHDGSNNAYDWSLKFDVISTEEECVCMMAGDVRSALAISTQARADGAVVGIMTLALLGESNATLGGTIASITAYSSSAKFFVKEVGKRVAKRVAIEWGIALAEPTPAGEVVMTVVTVGVIIYTAFEVHSLLMSRQSGNQKSDEFADWTDEEIAAALSELVGKLNKAQKELKRKLQKEQKARGSRNKGKSRGGKQ